MSYNVEVQGGSSIRLPTAGKYCDRDIVITAKGGGGTEDLNAVLTEQEALIAELQDTLRGKAAGGGGDSSLPAGYRRADYIQFTGKQVVDTGIACNQNTKIQLHFTRESSAQEYLYGVASSGNTASVTAYLGGSWRFGNKSVSKALGTTSETVGYDAFINKTTIGISGSVSSISGVNNFETVGSLLIGSCRSAAGGVGAAQFDGKILFFAMWEGDEQVLKLIPVTDGSTYRFFDMVSQKFFDSVTDTPLGGGDL